jgi:hypothetical protein
VRKQRNQFVQQQRQILLNRFQDGLTGLLPSFMGVGCGASGDDSDTVFSQSVREHPDVCRSAGFWRGHLTARFDFVCAASDRQNHTLEVCVGSMNTLHWSQGGGAMGLMIGDRMVGFYIFIDTAFCRKT